MTCFRLAKGFIWWLQCWVVCMIRKSTLRRTLIVVAIIQNSAVNIEAIWKRLQRGRNVLRQLYVELLGYKINIFITTPRHYKGTKYQEYSKKSIFCNYKRTIFWFFSIETELIDVKKNIVYFNFSRSFKWDVTRRKGTKSWGWMNSYRNMFHLSYEDHQMV